MSSYKYEVMFLPAFICQFSFLVLRFGRFIESLYATLPLLDDKKTSLHYILVFSKIANSLFLLADHVLWLGRADICSVNTEKWSQISNKYWLFSITMNLLKDFHDISQLPLKSKLSSHEVKSVNRILNTLIQVAESTQRNDVFIDTLRNSCDFFIPLTALGYVNLSPGTVGMLGTISSLLGLWVIVKPMANK